MGILNSCIKKVEAVRFHPFPSNKVVKCIDRLIRIDNCTYAITKNGTLYTTSEMAGKICYVGTAEKYHAIKALVAFGIITQEEARQHGEKKRKEDEAYDQYRAVTAEIEWLTNAGIELTKRQLARLAEMKKKLPVKRLPWYVQGEAAKKLGLEVKK